jgi:hypothetical protein
MRRARSLGRQTTGSDFELLLYDDLMGVEAGSLVVAIIAVVVSGIAALVSWRQKKLAEEQVGIAKDQAELAKESALAAKDSATQARRQTAVAEQALKFQIEQAEGQKERENSSMIQEARDKLRHHLAVAMVIARYADQDGYAPKDLVKHYDASRSDLTSFLLHNQGNMRQHPTRESFMVASRAADDFGDTVQDFLKTETPESRIDDETRARIRAQHDDFDRKYDLFSDAVAEWETGRAG